MTGKGAYGLMLTLLLTGVLVSAVNIQPVKASGTIYIKADGSIDPPTAPILTVDNITYTFTDNILNESIVVQRDNIVLEGNGYALQGNGSGVGISVCGDYIAAKPRINVTIKNAIIENFNMGIEVYYSINISIVGNNIKNNSGYGILLIQLSNYSSIAENDITANCAGINLACSSYNSIIGNDITVNKLYGIYLVFESSDNVIYHNNFIDNSYQTYVQTPGYANVWDNGYPSGGNWWSWWGKNTDTDIKKGPNQDQHGSDRIGDAPYIIDANNRDRYPVAYPYGSTPPPTYTLTITTTAGGTTNPQQGTYTYSKGQKVPVQATPNNGYVFDHWELDSTNIGSANPVNVTMNTNHNLRAVFTIPSGVGGILIPVDKFTLLAPYIGLASTIIVATVATAIYVKCVKRRKEKQ